MSHSLRVIPISLHPHLRNSQCRTNRELVGRGGSSRIFRKDDVSMFKTRETFRINAKRKLERMHMEGSRPVSKLLANKQLISTY
jgi:hypothetical protein